MLYLGDTHYRATRQTTVWPSCIHSDRRCEWRHCSKSERRANSSFAERMLCAYVDAVYSFKRLQVGKCGMRGKLLEITVVWIHHALWWYHLGSWKPKFNKGRLIISLIGTATNNFYFDELIAIRTTHQLDCTFLPFNNANIWSYL